MEGGRTFPGFQSSRSLPGVCEKQTEAAAWDLLKVLLYCCGPHRDVLHVLCGAFPSNNAAHHCRFCRVFQGALDRRVMALLPDVYYGLGCRRGINWCWCHGPLGFVRVLMRRILRV